MNEVTLSLISHTNVGKTTLARTLLRRDVGEVLDQAHVTEKSEAHLLLEEGGDRLLLWDTPGFGDTVRLLRRLRQEKNPLGWFLHEVWDRNTDRPLWCSQEAVRNVREDADVVLYLVNATEEPGAAGYVKHELELLAWIGRPVVVLLNQIGEGPATGERLAEWRGAMRTHEVVRDVLSLDAFARAWVQEGQLLQSLVPHLSGEKQAAMARLAAAWHRRNLEVFRTATQAIGTHLARAACDGEPLSGRASREAKAAAMKTLLERVATAEEALWDELIAAHGLEGHLARELKSSLSDYELEGEELFSTRKGAMIGGALSGAVGGLMADLFSGGLSLGGGLIAGTLLGALGGAGLSKAVHWVQGDAEPRMSWSPEFLEALLQQCLLRYMALAHFGRGRGALANAEHAESWRTSILTASEASAEERAALWKQAEERKTLESDLAQRLGEHVSRIAQRLFQERYPDAVLEAS